MNELELVSVVMPVHNGEKFLREAINSVLSQSHSNFELIIVNNCSSDSSSKIIDSYCDKRIKHIYETDCHLVSAYNRGFKEAASDFIFIVDQDDICNKERITKQLNALKAFEADICGSFLYIINEKSEIIGKSEVPTNDSVIKEQLLFKNWLVHNSTICLRKNILEQEGYFNKDKFPVADYDFLLRVNDKHKIINIPEYLYFYRKYRGQTTSRYRKQMYNKTLEISLDYLGRYDKKESDKSLFFKKGLIYYYNNHITKSFYYFLVAFLFGNSSKITFRYLLLTMILGIPVKIVRKSNFMYTKRFSLIKNYFNKVIDSL